ncbi:MAG: hypothetical protein ACR2KZ_01340, partial [Segetibacter sp.]
ELSCFQPYPNTSMAIVELVNLPFTANIIYIGGCDSCFVYALFSMGYQNMWVPDISEKAIKRAKQILRSKAS